MTAATQAGYPSWAVATFLAGGILASSLALGTSNGTFLTRDEFVVTTGSDVPPGSGIGHVDFWPLALLDTTPDGPIAPSDAENVRWLHENSGLTWDQLGKLFGVSRRTVHLWANGARMNAPNAEALAQAVRMVRQVAGQTPEDRRAAILAQTDGRTSLFEAFAASRRHSHELINAPAFRAADSLNLIPGDGTTGT